MLSYHANRKVAVANVTKKLAIDLLFPYFHVSSQPSKTSIKQALQSIDLCKEWTKDQLCMRDQPDQEYQWLNTDDNNNNNVQSVVPSREQLETEFERLECVQLYKTIQCNVCKSKLQSHSSYDFQTCTCGSLSVDGGPAIERTLFNEERDIGPSTFEPSNRQ